MRILKKLIEFFDTKASQRHAMVPEPPLAEVASSSGSMKVRPKAQSIIAALHSKDMLAAKRQLREWWIGLHRERLPSGDCWVIGGYFFYFEFQWPLVQAISDAFESPSNPRVFVGRAAFWRAASQELWETGQLEELYRRLRGALIVYDPQIYLIWARVLVCRGKPLEAGKYFLFSGLYDDSESAFVSQFKRTLARAHPNEIVGRMPGPCTTKRARRQFPPRVYEDLATVPSPDWLRRPPAQVMWMASNH
jgi:hypothetical protein